MEKNTPVGIPIEIVVSPEHAESMKQIVQTMIVNFSEWEAGKEPLTYQIGEHRTSQLIIKIAQHEGTK